MKKRKNHSGLTSAGAGAFLGQPEDCLEQIGRYGTYNIQPTNDTGNMFPSIAQGLPRSLHNTKITKDDLSEA